MTLISSENNSMANILALSTMIVNPVLYFKAKIILCSMQPETYRRHAA